ncbi:MAG: glycosyltransferase family 4 protein [Desulfobaccales bacterium]
MNYAVPVNLQRAGMLAHLYTDSYVGPGSAWHWLTKLDRVIPETWKPATFRRLLQRRMDGLPSEKITAFNLFGLRYALAFGRLTDLDALDKFFWEYGRKFCDLILQTEIPAADVVYGFYAVAFSLFNHVKLQNKIKILEKTSTPEILEYDLFSTEYNLWPQWESPYPDREVMQPLFELDRQEWESADFIFCASEFVAQGLTGLGVPKERIRVVPYGLEVARRRLERQAWDAHRPLRVLFLGRVTLRKGVQYFSEALRRLNSTRVEARIVGPVTVSPEARRQLQGVAEVVGPVTRAEVDRHYAWADLFVFPSICEGSAGVNYEALAAGLPVITTPNSGSVVRDGVDGFIVPIRDAAVLAEKIGFLASNPDMVAWMSQNAQERSKEFTWEKYGGRLVTAIQEINS